jgi:hypothetical protein
VVSFKSLPLYPERKIPQNLLYRRLGGLGDGLDTQQKIKISTLNS